jgi:hypothetical protein
VSERRAACRHVPWAFYSYHRFSRNGAASNSATDGEDSDLLKLLRVEPVSDLVSSFKAGLISATKGQRGNVGKKQGIFVTESSER